MKKIIHSIPHFLLIFACCLAWVGGATAQQTKKVAVQGFLKDANGKAVADGPQVVTFRLYPVAIGGTAEWTDTQTLDVFGGIYSTALGSSTNPIDNLNWNANTYYVGISIAGTELTPRTELTYAPYSLGVPKAQEEICSGAVGDVKYSILGPEQFATVNGTCWVPMDGRALATTDKLRQITGLTNVPNGGGVFLRNQEFQTSPATHDPDRTFASPIATLQDQSFLSHTHTGTSSAAGGHTHNPITYKSVIFDYDSDQLPRSGAGGINSVTQDNSRSHTHTLTLDNTGGGDTRPKNLNFWVYIRIN